MPTYIFIDKNTGETAEEFMSISKMEEFLKEHPHIDLVPASPMIVSGVMAGRNKPDDGFRDILREHNKRHKDPKAKVNTW